MFRRGKRLGWAVWIPMVLALAGCTTSSFDMSDGRIEPPGPDGGVVIGSVLVLAEQEPPQSWYNKLFGRKAAGFTYDFDIVHIGTSDPNGTQPYAKRYELDAKPGEERIFAARLPVGNYLIKTFHHEGLSAMGGDLGLIFSVAPDAARYIGRLLLEVPRRVTIGAPFTYKVEDGREATLAALRRRHPDLGSRVVNAPMQTR
ncbi:MAG TPA: hypothetical protein VLA99_17395 [Nitrospiraceae bacterium]|nr:hypothetical protein [Nitrospiraceae bacterium]